MGFNYGYDYSYAEPSFDSAVAGAFEAVFGFLLVFYLLILAYGVVAYVFQSLGFYKIAKRRGIHNPWLAWLPVGNMWILGSISDQYQYVVKGRVRNRRKVLLGLTLGMFALSFLSSIGAIVSLIAETAAMDASETLFGASLGIAVIAYLAIAIASIIAIVIQYMSLYDLYVSCDPYNGVLYLVLSIFVSVTMPFFIFACRNKDGGMPPRKEAEQPVFQTICEPATEE